MLFADVQAMPNSANPASKMAAKLIIVVIAREWFEMLRDLYAVAQDAAP